MQGSTGDTEKVGMFGQILGKFLCDETFCKTLGKHLGHSYRHFLGSTNEREKGPVILGFCDTDIPLTAARFERAQFTASVHVLWPEKEGYTAVPLAPNKAGKYTKGDDAKDLSEMHPWTPNHHHNGAAATDDDDSKDGGGGFVSASAAAAKGIKLNKMHCYPYGIRVGKPKEKGARGEHLKWEVVPGMPLRFSLWSDSARGGKSSSKGREVECDYAGDFIPAFSLVRFELGIKGYNPVSDGPDAAAATGGEGADEAESPVKKGYGMGLTKMTVLEGATLYSALNEIPHIFPSTGERAQEMYRDMQKKYPSIANVIQPERAAFFVRSVSKSANVDMDERPEIAELDPQIRISGWCTERDTVDAALPIDILEEHALAATNCSDIRSAVAMLQLAANAGALSLLVFRDKYRGGKERTRSALFAYPFVDGRELLGGIRLPIEPSRLLFSEDCQSYVFPAHFQVMMPKAIAAAAASPKKKQSKKKAKKDDDEDEESGDDESSKGGDNDGDDGEEEEEHQGKNNHVMDEDNEELQTPLILISSEKHTNILGDTPIKSPDFMLAGTNVSIREGFKLSIVHPVMQNFPLFVGVLNTDLTQVSSTALGYNNILAGAAAAAAAAGGKRNKWADMQEHVFETQKKLKGTAAVTSSSDHQGATATTTTSGGKKKGGDSSNAKGAAAANNNGAAGKKKGSLSSGRG